MNTTQDPQNEGLPLDPNAYATKLDIANLRYDFKDETATLRSEFKDDIAAVRSEISETKSDLKSEIAAVRSEIAETKSELKSEHTETQIGLAALTSRVEGLEKQMTSFQNQMKLMFVFQTGILIALVSLFLKGMF